MTLPATALLALLACAPARAQGGPGLSKAVEREIGRVEDNLRRTETGRRLLAETARVPRRGVARLEEGVAVAWRRGKPGELLYSLEALPKATEWDFELALVREYARAAMDLPLPVLEEESAAGLRQALHAAQKARADARFSQALRRGMRAWRDRVRAWRSARSWVRGHLGASAEVTGLSAKGELDRAALHLALFAEDPDAFYWAAEKPWLRGAHGYTWTELEDFLDRHRGGLDEIHFPEGSPYARAGGRRYPAALARAAIQVSRDGGLSRLREALGDLETLQAEALKQALKRWK